MIVYKSVLYIIKPKFPRKINNTILENSDRQMSANNLSNVSRCELYQLPGELSEEAGPAKTALERKQDQATK